MNHHTKSEECKTDVTTKWDENCLLLKVSNEPCLECSRWILFQSTLSLPPGDHAQLPGEVVNYHTGENSIIPHNISKPISVSIAEFRMGMLKFQLLQNTGQISITTIQAKFQVIFEPGL